MLACGIVFWQIREPQDSTTQAVETRPGLFASLRTILGSCERSARLLLLAIFAWFVGYNAVSKFFTPVVLPGLLALIGIGWVLIKISCAESAYFHASSRKFPRPSRQART